GPEYILAHMRPAAVPAYVRELEFSVHATGLRSIVNLNIATPPAWASDLAAGPLFAEQHAALDPELFATQAENLLDEVLAPARCCRGEGNEAILRADWHLSERDFKGAAAGRLLRLARRVMEGAPIVFAFDRRQKHISLGE